METGNNKMYYVYVLSCPNGKKYVGMTGQRPEDRWRSGWGYQKHEEMWADIVEYGWRNWEKQVIRGCGNKAEALLWEQYWIEELGTMENGYNRNGELKEKWVIVNEDSGECWSGVEEAAASVGRTRQALWRAIKTNGKCGGVNWKKMSVKEYMEVYLR